MKNPNIEFNLFVCFFTIDSQLDLLPNWSLFFWARGSMNATNFSSILDCSMFSLLCLGKNYIINSNNPTQCMDRLFYSVIKLNKWFASYLLLVYLLLNKNKCANWILFFFFFFFFARSCHIFFLHFRFQKNQVFWTTIFMRRYMVLTLRKIILVSLWAKNYVPWEWGRFWWVEKIFILGT